MLVGGRGGIGAAIAGAGASRSPNNIFAALGSMLSEGRDVNVPAGTALAVELERAVTLRGRGRLRGGEAATLYTAPERIRAAQTALRAEELLSRLGRTARSTTRRGARCSSSRSISG